MPRHIKIVFYCVGFLLLQFRRITILSYTNKSIDRKLQERAAKLLRHFWLYTIHSMIREGFSHSLETVVSILMQTMQESSEGCLPWVSLWMLSLSPLTIGWRIINLPSQIYKRNCFDNEESQVSRSNKVGAYLFWVWFDWG